MIYDVKSNTIPYFKLWSQFTGKVKMIQRHSINLLKALIVDMNIPGGQGRGSIQGQASGMDGTLALIFAISKTIRDSKKFIKNH